VVHFRPASEAEHFCFSDSAVGKNDDVLGNLKAYGRLTWFADRCRPSGVVHLDHGSMLENDTVKKLSGIEWLGLAHGISGRTEKVGLTPSLTRTSL
jgi:hypothetical protein